MTVDRNLAILIVDDYKTMLRIIRNLLHQLGFSNVEEAMDGTMALGKLRDRPYGRVISDWNMQPMTGLELRRAGAAAAPPPGTPRGRPYGVVLPAWNMQPMAGLELLREVRADAELKATPFIM